MTEYQLYCNFKNANKKASELDEIAESIRNLANRKISDEINQLKANWSGESSDAFVSKMNLLAEKSRREADKITEIANTIRKVAQRTYDTEMRALEISRRRTYK